MRQVQVALDAHLECIAAQFSRPAAEKTLNVAILHMHMMAHETKCRRRNAAIGVGCDATVNMAPACKYYSELILPSSTAKRFAIPQLCGHRCGAPAKLQCPKCLSQGLPKEGSVFCSQDCFKVGK